MTNSKKPQRPADDPALNTRELIYIARDLGTPRADALIATVMAAVAALAHEVADAHGCTVRTWLDSVAGAEANEACFTDGPIKALIMLAAMEGAL